MIRGKMLLVSMIVMIFHTGCESLDKITVGEKFDKISTKEQHKDSENRLEAINGTYKLSPPDSLFIAVSDNEDLTTSVIIRPDGNIFFPLLGDVYIEGLTPLEIREKIHKLLGRYLRDLPEEAVTVTVSGFNSKVVYVYSYGAGIRQIPFTGDLTVLSAITKSGLLIRTDKKGAIKVIRGESDTVEKPQTLVVNLNDITNKGKTEKNIVLRPNDIVYIPPTFLARLGFLVRDMLNPIQPAAQLGTATSSIQSNRMGFTGQQSNSSGRNR
jgi:polysaccharide export outer membrane protein